MSFPELIYRQENLQETVQYFKVKIISSSIYFPLDQSIDSRHNCNSLDTILELLAKNIAISICTEIRWTYLESFILRSIGWLGLIPTSINALPLHVPSVTASFDSWNHGITVCTCSPSFPLENIYAQCGFLQIPQTNPLFMFLFAVRVMAILAARSNIPRRRIKFNAWFDYVTDKATQTHRDRTLQNGFRTDDGQTSVGW